MVLLAGLLDSTQGVGAVPGYRCLMNSLDAQLVWRVAQTLAVRLKQGLSGRRTSMTCFGRLTALGFCSEPPDLQHWHWPFTGDSDMGYPQYARSHNTLHASLSQGASQNCGCTTHRNEGRQM
jgi:hypothetical protein